jgi:hypothetical protein
MVNVTEPNFVAAPLLFAPSQESLFYSSEDSTPVLPFKWRKSLSTAWVSRMRHY